MESIFVVNQSKDVYINLTSSQLVPELKNFLWKFFFFITQFFEKKIVFQSITFLRIKYCLLLTAPAISTAVMWFAMFKGAEMNTEDDGCHKDADENIERSPK